MTKLKYTLTTMLVVIATMLSACGSNTEQNTSIDRDRNTANRTNVEQSVDEVQKYEESDSLYPAFDGDAYIELSNNIPNFTDSEMTTTSYETYAELDELGRCGVTMACVGTDIMPTDDRGSISSVKPSGWVNNKYDIVDGGYIYNRCHLIGYQLTGENANKGNLITGTRYLNIEGMLPFENMVADFVKETDMHVMYRVTPVFEGDNLVASGVIMEGKSVEDNGEGISFNVYCYNVQPGIEIDYATGDNWLSGEEPVVKETEQKTESNTKVEKADEQYVLNTKTMKVHEPDCSSAKDMSEENKEEFTGTLNELLAQGYKACGICKPQ